ncbi:uncharacterized protein [Onthophagus taurus]|uniref:uncharacterized protein n=1 Tax=Onthophagus taurus TaxID=166361 RepID=UPI0039BEBF71
MSNPGDKTSLNPFFERQNEVFGFISRTIDNLKKVGRANWSCGTLRSRVERLESNWNDFNDVHKQLIPYQIEYASTAYFTDDIFNLCENEYLNAKAFMLDILDPSPVPSAAGSDRRSLGDLPVENPPVTVNQTNPPHVGVKSGSRHLPQISLPIFDGNFANWTQYRDLFFSMVNNNDDISEVEKLQYLKMSLVKEPAQLLKNLLVKSANFQRAWNLLIERYENRRVLIDSHLPILFPRIRLNRNQLLNLND